VPEPFRSITSRVVVVERDHVDTDQIIPARFLTTTSRDGLGTHAFADWRGRPGCPLDAPGATDAKILVGGSNFGCGSSREHAVWALLDFGFRVVIAQSFGDIFRRNALENGLLTVQVGAEVVSAIRSDPEVEVEVDLETCGLQVSGWGITSFEVDAFGRHCLLHGVDTLGFLLEREADIQAFERARAEGAAAR
jgi:3-isopropylmalate/(R)-2-methylmalate dehydratase small subunit